MESKKKQKLEESYERIINVGFCIVPYEDLSDIIGPDPMVYGTAKDERILSFEGVDALFRSQFEQMGNMKPAYDRKRIALRISNDGNNACIIEEITLKLSSDEEIHTIFMRATCVMEYLDNQWKLTHWHTSTPVDTENDPWHMEEWKREKEKLQQLVDQQTVDLQLKNRELQIEAALERVRARAMAMQHSNELAELVSLVFTELVKLDFSLTRCYIYIIDPDAHSLEAWTFNTEIGGIPTSFRIQYLDLPYYNAMIKAWQAQEKKLVYELSGEDKKETDRVLFGETAYKNLPEPVKAGMASVEKVYLSFSFNHFGAIQTGGLEPLSEEKLEIFDRFGNVFDLTYTRFNDLKQAEAQAREVEIQLALERVRAASMAMHQSKELHDVIKVVANQIKELGINFNTANFTRVNDDLSWEFWVTTPEQPYPSQIHVPFIEHRLMKRMSEINENDKDFWSDTYDKEAKNTFFHHFFENTIARNIPDERKNYVLSTPGMSISSFVTRNILLSVAIYECTPFTDEENKIFSRFAKVFEQTYTRFLDLQKAEAQAREAQIESALERVRSKTMAMHSSADVDITVITLFEELVKLGLDKSIRSGIGVLNQSRIMEVWTGSNNPSSGQTFLDKGILDMGIHQLLKEVQDAWEAKKSTHTYELAGDDLISYFKAVNDAPDYSIRVDFEKLPHKIFHYDFFFPDGILFAFSPVPFSDETARLFSRFAAVFAQTYRRFLDLQKAEAQAKEAQIEAALERVRSKTMAMHNSQDVGDTVAILFDELTKLGIQSNRCGIVIFNETPISEIWTAKSNRTENDSLVIGRLDVNIHPLLKSVRTAWEKNESLFSFDMDHDYLIDYYQAINTYREYPTSFNLDALPQKETLTDFFFEEGALFAFTNEPIQKEVASVYKRFAGVFGQTYRRYLDLQKAEAQVQEAIKRASVDRVRAEIASMRTTSDLERITPLIWNELTTLGVPFIRSGVFIMDEEKQQVQTHLSTPDGKAIAAFQLKYEATNQSRQIVSHWREKKIFKDHMDETAFIEYTRNLVEQGAVAAGEKYLTENRPTNLHLHFFPFLQGMLYVGNTAPLSDDELHLAQNLADAFSTAYARYEDFNKLETAKKQVDKALIELKQAQQQLILSEKMASLGELTAGIAHEIQNPLNFVNNFSEVSKELLDEMKEAIEQGDAEEAREIMKDVIENLEKINHHGKRADGIVKGMLQHSRASSGQKEPTDINALADEYLRLSYHGLRAKDKSFNADFKIDIDPNLPKINVIPQDIGRVLLNLINNAFYTVSEKSKKGITDYKPQVIVKTKKHNHLIEIRVKDNGDGIPDNIVNKIFQPFFTTKPTGQGTGLGLSLSYDIITKGHNGMLEVDTTEG
jgi:signal transduction histidine kinase